MQISGGMQTVKGMLTGSGVHGRAGAGGALRWTLLLAVLAGTAACKAEDGTPLVKEKGVYQGAPMPEFSPEAIDAARERARITQGQL